MPITAAELMVKVGYNGDAVDSGMERTSGKVSGAAVAIGTAVGNIASNIATQLPGAMFSAATSMEDAMTGIGTLVGTSSEQFADLEAGIKSMVASSPDSPDDLGSAAYTFLSAGVTDTTQVLKGLQDATDLAGAGLGSTADATDLITSAMNNFKGEGLDSEKAAKLFFGTIASGKTTTAELAQGFGSVAPTAAAAGVSMNDLMAATATITSTGKGASEAYTGLKATMAAVIKPTKEAADTAEKLGINFSAAHLQAVGLPAFLNEVSAATGGNIETMSQLFSSQEALGTAMVLTGSSADAFAKNLTGVAEAGGVMAERAAEADETVSARFAMMKNKVMIALGDLGQKVFPALFDVIERLAPIASNIASQVQSGFNAMRAAFQGFGVADSGFIGAAARIGVAARQVVEWFKANWPQIRDTIIQTFTNVRTAIEAAWPIVQGILTTGFETLRVVTTAVFPVIQDIISRVITAITDEIMPKVMPVLEAGREAFQSVVEIVQQNWPQISEVIQQVGDIIASVMEVIATVTGTYMAAVTEIWTRYGDQIMAVVGFIFGYIVDLISGVMSVIQGVIHTILALVHGDWEGAWNGIKETLRAVWEVIKTVVSTAIELVGVAIWAGLEKVKGFFNSAWDSIVAGVSSVPGRITSAASNLFDGIKEAFRSAINWIIDRWNGLEFSMPSVDTHIPGVGVIGGWSMGTPNIPGLDQGGTVIGAGLTLVGERRPELLNLPRGASVIPLDRAGAAAAATYVTANVYMPAGSSGDDVVRALKQYERLNGSVPIRVTG